MSFVQSSDHQILGLKADKPIVLKTSIARNGLPRVECVQTIEQFAQLKEHWQRLETRSNDGFTVFQSFDWCMNWWQTVGQKNQDARLCIMTMWHDAELVAVWPLMNDLLPLGTRTLLPLTMPHAEYSNLIFDASLVDRQSLALFVENTIEQFDGDLVSLSKIPEGTALQIANGQNGTRAPEVEIASIFDLSQFETFEQYQSGLSKSTRRNRNKRKNKLARLGDLSYQTYFADAPEYADLATLALQMKRDWLIRTGRNDAKLIVDGLTKCICTLKGNSINKTGAVAGALMLDGKAVAVEIGFLERGHYYSYVGAFDWEMSEHSVGKIQIEEALKWAIETGVDKYDLLAEPAGYKDAWSNNQVALQNRVFPRSARGYIVGVLWQLRLRPLAKKVFNQLPSNWRKKVVHIVHSLRGSDQTKAP